MKWIPTKERKPRIGEWVLIPLKRLPSHPQYEHAILAEDGVWYIWDYIDVDERAKRVNVPSHWMKVVTPYLIDRAKRMKNLGLVDGTIEIDEEPEDVGASESAKGEAKDAGKD